MKKLKLFLLLIVSYSSYGQNYLGISKVITNFMDTVNVNQSVSYKVYIKNYGPAVFSGYFNVNTWVDSSGTSNNFHFSRLDTILSPVTINPGDSILFNTGDTYDLATYRVTGNVVVVWPKTYQTGWQTLDSVFHDVYVRGSTGVGEFGEEGHKFLMWPNPAINELNILPDEKFQKEIEDVRILDYLGQTVFISPFERKINIADLLPGIYLLELRTKKESYYGKFIKKQ